MDSVQPCFSLLPLKKFSRSSLISLASPAAPSLSLFVHLDFLIIISTREITLVSTSFLVSSRRAGNQFIWQKEFRFFALGKYWRSYSRFTPSVKKLFSVTVMIKEGLLSLTSFGFVIFLVCWENKNRTENGENCSPLILFSQIPSWWECSITILDLLLFLWKFQKLTKHKPASTIVPPMMNFLLWPFGARIFTDKSNYLSPKGTKHFPPTFAYRLLI